MRLFLAVAPPSPVLAALEGIERANLPGVRWTSAPQWHVTLRFLGEVSTDDVAALVEAVRSAVLPAAVMAVPGESTGSFGREVLHVSVDGLAELAGAVAHASARFGAPPEARPYRGHITLARARRGGADLRALAGRPVAVPAWPVTSFELVRSALGQGAPRYTVVERFSLQR